MREQHPPSTLMLVGLVLGVLAINRLAFARPDTCTVGADDPGSSGMRPTPPPRHTKPSQPAQPRRRVIVLRQFQAHPPPTKHAPFRPPQTRLEEGGLKHTRDSLFAVAMAWQQTRSGRVSVRRRKTRRGRLTKSIGDTPGSKEQSGQAVTTRE